MFIMVESWVRAEGVTEGITTAVLQVLQVWGWVGAGSTLRGGAELSASTSSPDLML